MNDEFPQEVRIHISDAAVKKVTMLLVDEKNPLLKLRMFVTGGGCSGLQYGFTFDELTNEDDFIVEKGGITLLIDPMSNRDKSVSSRALKSSSVSLL